MIKKYETRCRQHSSQFSDMNKIRHARNLNKIWRKQGEKVLKNGDKNNFKFLRMETDKTRWSYFFFAIKCMSRFLIFNGYPVCTHFSWLNSILFTVPMNKLLYQFYRIIILKLMIFLFFFLDGNSFYIYQFFLMFG